VFVALISTPGISAPDASKTVPVSVPLPVCANALLSGRQSSRKKAGTNVKSLLMADLQKRREEEIRRLSNYGKSLFAAATVDFGD
jgi:hypothetical protein